MVKPTLSSRVPLRSGMRAPGEVKDLTVALVGNANVGKSVIFNQLTGSNQVIGNWPGKTVERAEGWLQFGEYRLRIVDLPGIYSLSTYSLEESISRNYIISEKPNVVVNVVDASVLERNLSFTLQLIEMEAPLVVCLNQMDMAKKKGVTIDHEKLGEALGVPVVPTIAIKGEGLYELVKTVVDVAEGKHRRAKTIRYSDEVESRIEELSRKIDSEGLSLPYPSRWVAIKLLEKDPEIWRMISSMSRSVIELADKLSDELSTIYGEPSYAVIVSERYSTIRKILGDVVRQSGAETTLADRLDWIVTHRVLGYPISAGILAGLILWTFTVGDFTATLISDIFGFFEPVDPVFSGPLLSVVWNGVFGGLVAGITLVIPFVIPFYLFMAILEDSGMLTRVAFMMDGFMHRIGLHGKAIIPMVLGYGCNVPAIYTTRIMEGRRERLLTALAITFVPCGARTIIILGLVAVLVGVEWALLLYFIGVVIIFIAGFTASRLMPGRPTGLIMEMHAFRAPSLRVVVRQTLARTKSIILVVFPIYMVGSALVQALYALGTLEPLNSVLSPLTVQWLGLPAVSGVPLILGLVRKELILLSLVSIFGTEDLTLFLTPVQLLVLALVSMLYLPCVPTFATLVREFGWRPGLLIVAANISTAILVGGVASRILPLVFV